MRLPLIIGTLLFTSAASIGDPTRYFKIKVIDKATGRGVPLVELRTTNETRWYTDSNGVVAFYDDGLMGQKVYFSISTHGYSYPSDAFGNSGIALDVRLGGSVEVGITRVNIAERLYRITGEGIYRDSELLGIKAPTANPLLNGKVMGQDTVEVTPYKGKLYWFWGDTNRLDYPLGNFHTSGATSQLPASGGMNPDLGVNLTYFTQESGFCKEMLPNKAPGPVWIGGLCTVRNAAGTERLLCNYARMKALSEPVERGLAVFDDKREVFQPTSKLDVQSPVCPLGHPFHGRAFNVVFIYSATSDDDPVPAVRVPADLTHIQNPASYEAFSCLAPGTHFDGNNTKVDRWPNGEVHYSWKLATSAQSWKQEQALIKMGLLKPGEALTQLRDVDSGKPIQPAGGSVYWNSYHHRWVMIVGQLGGSSSLLGEIWYAEADTPTGPWVYAKKIVTHNNYTFYNPTQHPYFDSNGGKRIYFEGTYTKTFSGNKDPTPRYEYNQIMYGLSLDNPALALPQPVFVRTRDTGVSHFVQSNAFPEDMSISDIRGISFFAIPSRYAHEGLVPLYELDDTGRLVTDTAPGARKRLVAYVVANDRGKTGGALTPLYEYRGGGGSWYYSTEPALNRPGYAQSPDPVCRIWRNPMSFLPLDWETTPEH